MSSSTPQSLAAWLKLLDGIRLPVPRGHFERVRSAINDSRRSLREIADLMQQSPALVLSVMREANRHASGSLTEPAESLEVAITRLGIARTAQLLERLPVLAPEDIPVTLRQFQLISQHASQQANGLFAARLARLWQEIHWGSLLFLSPLWPLALSHPALLEAWESRVLHKGEPAAKVEQELFNVPLMALCEAVAVHWRLPGWVLHGYQMLREERRLLVRVMHIARDNEHRLRQQRQLDDTPTLRRWLNQPANTVLLANGLALSSQQAWDTPHMTRWQYLTSLYLQVPLEEIQQQCHQQAVVSARQHAAPGLWHPAEALIWPWQIRRLHRDLLPAAAPGAQGLALWRQRCAELLVEPSPFNNAVHLTSVARDALQACGMQRILMLMIDKPQAALRVHQAAGLSEEAASLSLPLANSSVLQRLATQPAQIRLSTENQAQFRALLPAALLELFAGDHLLLRSLSSHGRVVMILVADQGGVPFADVSVQAFGKTAQCIERALTSFSNRSG